MHKRATTGAFTCWVCRVAAKHEGSHVVAITLLPDIANIAAAIGANILLQHCQQVRYLIMCGIAGAVPSPDKPEDHVRLGDIVVSGTAGIIQYDRGKQRDPRRSANDSPDNEPSHVADPFSGFEYRHPPRRPCPELLAAVKRIHADEELLSRHEARCWELEIERFTERFKEPKWRRPDSRTDRLNDSPNGVGDATRHPRDRLRRKARPRVFVAPIGAASIVLADPTRRDMLRDRHGVRAVEMEGSGIADASWLANVGYLVIRGTCDYCNSTKNDDWHHYAALAAAAYTRTVVEYSHPATDLAEPTTLQQLDQNALRATVLVNVGSDVTSFTVANPPVTSDRTQAETIVGLSMDTSTTFQIPTTQRPVARDVARGIAGITREGHAESDANAHIDELTSRIERLMKEFRWSEVYSLVNELEKRLRELPRKGTRIREGWIVLARVEDHRLRTAELASPSINVSRLHTLRQEAENVAD